MNKLRLISILFFFLPAALHLVGQEMIELQKIVGSDLSSMQDFGKAVAADGNRMLVGTEREAAYLFELDGMTQKWIEVAKLEVPESNRFGESVAINGDHAIVGSHLEDNIGAAYIFSYDSTSASWGSPIRLTASDAAPNDRFGWSVSISGSRAVVGSIGDFNESERIGAAYVFDWDPDTEQWEETAILTASDEAPGLQFGFALSLYEDQVVIGSLDTVAYVFARSIDTGNWQETARLMPEDVEGEAFAETLSLYENRFITGAWKDDHDRGSAYIFDRDTLTGTWSQTVKIKPENLAILDAFGFSVALHGNTALIGSFGDDDNGFTSGSAHLYQLDTMSNEWLPIQKLNTSDGAPGDNFAFAVALTENWALLGAQHDDDAGNNSGSAYIFGVDQAPVDILLSGSQIGELTPPGTLIGNLSSLDINPADAHTYALVNGPGDTHNELFEIIGNKLLNKETFVINGDTTYHIRIQTQDERGGTFQKTFSIAITELVDTEQLLSASTQVAIFPNPASDMIRLEWLGENITDLTITGYDGKVWLRQRPVYQAMNEIDISALPVGLYTLRLQTNVGVVVHKLVVQ